MFYTKGDGGKQAPQEHALRCGFLGERGERKKIIKTRSPQPFFIPLTSADDSVKHLPTGSASVQQVITHRIHIFFFLFKPALSAQHGRSRFVSKSECAHAHMDDASVVVVVVGGPGGMPALVFPCFT